MTYKSSKIQGKFYRLQNNGWFRFYRELKPVSIDDWKEALGKILAYAAFFPNHNQRIRLFRKSNITKLALDQATCSEFDVAVTFEEVQ